MEHRILIVDDDKELTTALQNVFFFGQGYEVLVENDGDSAKKVIDRTPLDLILLDIEMPGISGIEVLKYVKIKRPDTKVIMVTGYGEYEEKTKKLGSDAFIRKPFAFRELEKTIASLLDKKGFEEMREFSLGHKIEHASKGSPLADIMIVEPITALATPIVDFLKDSSKAGGYYRVYHVETVDQALNLQSALLINIVLIDLKTVTGAESLVESLSKNDIPPKDFIFYLKSSISTFNDVIQKINGKYWDGNPMQEDGLGALAEIIKSIAKEHDLVKK